MKTIDYFLVAATVCLGAVSVPSASAGPTVINVAPPPGAVSARMQITITFSTAVTGVEASDLVINGAPATGVGGSGGVRTFAFTQPPAGALFVSWDGSHSIYDLAGNRFDELSAGATWSYTLADTILPTVSITEPTPAATVGVLTNIQITFKEPVTGVDAADLLINGQAAASVNGSGSGPYLFSFAQPANGTITVNWAGGPWHSGHRARAERVRRRLVDLLIESPGGRR